MGKLSKITQKERQNSPFSEREIPHKKGDTLIPPENTIILYPCVTKDRGGKEDAHYVPNQSYQRFE